jgi:hypothetical protein
MKKNVLIYIFAVLLIGAAALWISKAGFKTPDIIMLTCIVIVVGFAILFGLKRIDSAKRGEPVEDELSKKILTKASSVTFYISIYQWLIIMYFSDKVRLETHTLIGTGIIGMAIIFAICWLVIYMRGVRNE